MNNKIIFDYVCANLDNYNELVKYIIDIEEYQKIYDNESLSLYVKEKYNIIIMNVNDINNEFKELELKESIENIYKNYRIIWI